MKINASARLRASEPAKPDPVAERIEALDNQIEQARESKQDKTRIDQLVLQRDQLKEQQKARK